MGVLCESLGPCNAVTRKSKSGDATVGGDRDSDSGSDSSGSSNQVLTATVQVAKATDQQEHQ